MEDYSLSDLKAVTSGDGFGNGSAWWIIILFLFMFRNGYGGNCQEGFGGAATAAAQNEILLGQQFGGINGKLNELGNGLCNSTYALNNSITGEGRHLSTQLADCCCENRLAVANLGAKLDQQTCAITTAVHGEADATRAMMLQQENERTKDMLYQERTKNSLLEQSQYLLGQAGKWYGNPPCNSNPCGCGCGNY